MSAVAARLQDMLAHIRRRIQVVSNANTAAGPRSRAKWGSSAQIWQGGAELLVCHIRAGEVSSVARDKTGGQLEVDLEWSEMQNRSRVGLR